MMKRKLRILLRYLAALLVALSILAPMAWLFLMSVSAAADLTRVPLEWLPRQWDFSRYARLLSLQPGEPGALFLPALRNSLLVAAGATLVSLLLAVPAAFSFSRYPGRDGWLYAGLGIYMVPPVAFVLPLYFILEHFGLLNTRSGLVLVYCSLIMPFLAWMVKISSTRCRRILSRPPDLTVCGSGRCYCASPFHWQTHAGGVGAVRLAAGLGRVFYALLFTSNIAAQTLPVTIAGFTAGRATDDGLVAAVGILASVPPLFIAIWLQKTLVSGLTHGGSKG